MALVTPSKISMAGLILASGFMVSPVEVQAQSFFERLFGGPSYEERRRMREEELRRERERARPKVRISSPRYYTYRPDAVKTYKLATLAVPPAPQTAQTAQTPPASSSVPATAPADGSAQTASAPATAPVTAPPPTAFEEARIYLKSFKLRMPREVGKALIAHYAQHPEFIWVKDGKVDVKARSAMALLQHVDRFGLVPSDYQVALPAPEAPLQMAQGDADAEQPDPAEMARLAKEARQKELVTFEMAMSARVLTYVLDATRGRIDPNRLSGYHDLPRRKVDLKAAMQEIETSDDIAKYLTGRQPQSWQFKALEAELARLVSEGEGQHIEIAPGTLLKPGRSNPELANIMAAIKLRASEALREKHAAVLAAYAGTPDYTPEIVQLVRDFQRENKLGADGIIGRRTIAALMGGDTNASKIRKVKFAMERLRWLPREFGQRYVFINQPAYRATYFNNGKPELSMRVVVGKKTNQTSFFYDEIETVEFNPYWGVPLSIIVNEMLPKLSADPSYLDRIGYEVTTARGKRVSSSSVDWYGVASRNVPINVRQLPGRKNALGELKILFPNKHAIYMHDTPSKSLFKRDRRALSHGCIRLQDPRGMAAAVLGTSKEYIASRIAGGRNDKDTLNEKIPVYVSYFTAWPEADGSVKYFDDVYDRDKRLGMAMKGTTRARQS